MKTRPFQQVDVFTDQPYFGNPLAVVLDGQGLDDAAMQRFARWTNLSETTFLLPPHNPAADYRVRIFTPDRELDFAGHPTLGSCHSWLQAGGTPRSREFIVQECRVGLVKIRPEPIAAGRQRLAFAAPLLKRSAPSPAVLAQIAAALGLKASQIIAAQVLDNGLAWHGLLLDSPDTVLQITPDYQALAKLNVDVGVASIYPRNGTPQLIARASREAQAFGGKPPADAGPAPDLEVRAFVGSVGGFEDPVTGGLNASLAQWLIADKHAPERYLASQGVCLGRAGQVYIERDASGQVWVGGESVTCIAGQAML
ncbi:MAG: PhzF family phenazine biosynthesis protein [Polaromonas sp.]|uniref:PhzF family phenazine biosynthesis protein n=1 Tax=Polaromonas sp. TaxID=1869339 RepID=UPI002734028C|nr:PhzF family phenazine biosynthesis protein [Polaromonas sp.]MDP3798221.1 PhzF family phenazine biosynthesis protein [Polaromonas sp.]